MSSDPRPNEPPFPPGPSRDQIPARGSVLGVDYGTVRIGLALGELGSGLVVPIDVVANPGSLEGAAERIVAVARERGVAAVVLGNPVHMSGEASDMSRAVAALRDLLLRALACPILLRDERLTSVEAQSTLAAQGLKWWQYPKERLDALAAMQIVKELLVEHDPSVGRLNETPDSDAPLARREKDERRRKARKRRD